jgi:mannitol 2-dehydrogenase
VTSPDAVHVSLANLDAIAARGIVVPGYDRSSLAPRILHVGVGGFHRAHMARYTDELASLGGDWGIRGAGLLAGDLRMATTLASQDHLYTLIEGDSKRTDISIVGSIIDFALVSGDEEAFARNVRDPAVEILSLTITEGGYSLREHNPTIEAIVTALEGSLCADGRPLTVLSCDNLPGNGDVARSAVLSVAARRSPQLAGRLRVAAQHLGTKRQLEKWIAIGTVYAKTLPPK